MTVEYRLLEPTEDANAGIRLLATDFMRALDDFWQARGKDWYGRPAYEVDPIGLSMLWQNRVAVIFLAMDGDVPVGILFGYRRRPPFSDSLVFQVEAFHGRTPEIENGLLDEFCRAFKYFPETFVEFPDYVSLGGRFRPGVSRTVTEYGR
jgi:hypothetical protein